MKPKIILAAMILSGSTQLMAAPAPVSEAASSQSSIEKRLASLENMMQSRNFLQVELQQQLNLLQDEVSQIRGVTEEQSYKLEKVLQRQRELYQEIENRVSQAYTQPTAAPVIDQAQPNDAQSYSSDLSENEAYERAVALIMKDKRYDQAIPEFQTFLTTYPNSVYASNAHYWLGQLLTIKNDGVKAVEHFKVVVNEFPNSNKRPDAMLKLGTLLQDQGSAAQAQKILSDLINQYPSTTAAKLATDRLGN
ncbi:MULTISPECIES: tol-pal system protein YbgF [unclassified Pseudoalteromonas]|uniref:tol-pal system protein YbgF n=1 Tax=unclassified Pseudoalteromonas TaxID=194690 RepID=UPI0015F7B604|nr:MULTISPECIES: tol-pal system protein YbgF [unclassified Pseudoalteromonas]MBB1350958.1 tol-pal system protein YbgF [Pseudoalteromonas sp. SG45-3]MBB1354106.1 tol-pal system protein YbgF [Pseudoalteromonas sp. SR45-5]MBB1359496.1 tol-pal system protein YbgF [Pseudoalteromonas sp. SG45-6]